MTKTKLPTERSTDETIRGSHVTYADAVSENVETLRLAEERIIDEHHLYHWHLPGRPLAHYAEIYGKDFLHPKLDRFDSYQRMGLGKISQGTVPEPDTPEYAQFLLEHRLCDPVPSKRFMIDYLEAYRKNGETDELFARLSEEQKSWIRRIDSLRRRYRESRDAAVTSAVETALAEEAA